jgi:hypothetical protein
MRRRTLLSLAVFAWTAPAPALAGDREKKKVGGDSYIEIDTLTAYSTKPNGRRGVMTVDCGLDIPDPDLRARAQLLLPRLRAEFVQVVQIYAGGLPSGMPPNPDFLADGLQRVADRVLGRRGARVLIGAVLAD